MKNIYYFLIGICLIMSGCTPKKENQLSQSIQNNSDTKILVAYFTRLKNTDSDDIDEIIAGGGPYGKINKSDTDTLSSASIQLDNDSYCGNTEKIAKMISQSLKASLYSIETTKKYPIDYQDLIDQGNEENKQNFRPQLSADIKNMNEYDIVFIGFPDWYYDIPMAVGSFIEKYDFKKKTVIPFCTSAGSGFAKSLETLDSLLSSDTTIANGLDIHMNDIENCQDRVFNWLKELGFQI